MYIVNASDRRKAAAHTALFHPKTFRPSNTPKGMRLKKAMKALMNALYKAMVERLPVENIATPRNIVESTRLVEGPAREIFPIVSLLPLPAIITAPGEMILKRGESMEIRVKRAPTVVNRNSAQNPKC